MAIKADDRPVLPLDVRLVLHGEVDNGPAFRDDSDANTVPTWTERNMGIPHSWAHCRRASCPPPETFITRSDINSSHSLA